MSRSSFSTALKGVPFIGRFILGMYPMIIIIALYRMRVLSQYWFAVSGDINVIPRLKRSVSLGTRLNVSHSSSLFCRERPPPMSVFILLLFFSFSLITAWGDVDLLQPAAGIKTVYFEANPIAKDPQYRRKLKLALPPLTQIDATMVPRTN